MGGGHHHNPAAMPKEEQDIALLKKEQVPIAYRDKCAHLLVPLNRCRRETWFSPNQCGTQRHLYEECQYIAWEHRCEAKQKMEAAAAAAAAAAAQASAAEASI